MKWCQGSHMSCLTYYMNKISTKTWFKISQKRPEAVHYTQICSPCDTAWRFRRRKTTHTYKSKLTYMSTRSARRSGSIVMRWNSTMPFFAFITSDRTYMCVSAHKFFPHKMHYDLLLGRNQV